MERKLKTLVEGISGGFFFALGALVLMPLTILLDFALLIHSLASISVGAVLMVAAGINWSLLSMSTERPCGIG